MEKWKNGKIHQLLNSYKINKKCIIIIVMENYYNSLMEKVNNFDYSQLHPNNINMKSMSEKVKGVVSNKLIMFLIGGVVISFIVFNLLSLLFKTPLIIIIGLILGYIMYKAQSKVEMFLNRK